MSREVESASYIGELQISKKNYARLLMWGQSEKEINFICFGKRHKIDEVIRIANTASSPKKFASWHEKVSKTIVRTKESEGKTVVACGHSHPYKWNDQHPSKPDIEAIKNGQIEIIVFPSSNSVRAWRIGKTLKKTLASEILLSVC